MRPVILGAALVLPAVLAAGPGSAQTDPAARALIQQLLPRTSSETTRGIRPVGPSASPVAPAAPVAAPATQPVAPPPVASAPSPRPAQPPVAARTTTAPEGMAAASITVTFPSGSADLTPQAMAALAPLGQALASRDLAAYRFRIEGHTDTVGSRELNQALSERRAAAVRDFLVQRYGVGASRLEIVGRGEDDLLVPTGDNVPDVRNRRVQVVNLGG